MTTPHQDQGLVSALRADLRAAEYTVDGVQAALGPVAAAALHREQVVPARRALASAHDPRAALCALFLTGDDVPRHVLDAALPQVGTAGAQQLGLVKTAGQHAEDQVRAVCDLRPYAATDARGAASWWLASDLGEAVTGAAVRPDHVLGAGGASVTLAQVTMRTPVARVLDLGTGCGIQALHASRHADHITATDISVRALGFAAFNAALNEVPLDLRHGSMLEPVAGETFDLVVSNPPFVITPRGLTGPRYEYRDGGRGGDDVVRDLILGVGSVLAPGGVAQFLGNWEHHRGRPWDERVGEWLDQSGLDGWVIQREVLDPAEYAETWIRDGGTTARRDPEGWARAYAAWLDDFASRDVDAVGFGIITLRKPAGGGGRLRRVEEHTGPITQPLGAQLAAGLATLDWLVVHDDAALAATHLTIAGDITEERFFIPGAPDPSVIWLRQGGGLGRVVEASTGLAALAGACDGELPVGRLIAAVAALFEVPAADLAGELLPAVRGLIRDGFLVPGNA